jgi:hypothetical protein
MRTARYLYNCSEISLLLFRSEPVVCTLLPGNISVKVHRGTVLLFRGTKLGLRVLRRVLRETFGPTRTTVTFGLREFCTGERHDFTDSYCVVQVKEDEIGGPYGMRYR